MKKIMALVLALILLLTLSLLTACNGKNEPVPTPSDDPPVTKPVDPVDENGDEEFTYDMLDLWQYLNGYWADEEGFFIGFFCEGAELRFEYGLLYSEYWRGGFVIGDEPIGFYIFRITVYFAAEEASEAFDARDEEMLVFYLDATELSDDVIQTSSSDDPFDWTRYTYLGDSLFSED